MLHELNRIYSKDESGNIDDYRRAASVLLNRQFLYADKRRDKGFYHQILSSEDYFWNLFDALNLDLICDPQTGYVGIVPRESHITQGLDTEHTLLLLSLRVLYENAVLECRIVEGGQVLTDSDNLMDFYEFQTGRKKPGLVRLREILGNISRQGLLDFDGEENRVIQVRIRPAIRDIVSTGWMETLENYKAVKDIDNGIEAGENVFNENLD